MLQNPATKALIAVPGYSRLFRRRSTYYFRVGVPTELRSAVGKREILKSLRTSDFQKAKQLVAFESATADALFEKERLKLRPAQQRSVELRPLSDAEIQRLVFEWFQELEKKSEQVWEQGGRFYRGEDLSEMIEGLRVDQAIVSGAPESDYFPEDGSTYAKRLFTDRGVSIPGDLKIWNRVCELCRKAMAENVRRDLIRYDGPHAALEGEPLFREIFAHTFLPSLAPLQQTITLGELLNRYMAFVKAQREESTYTTYKTPARVLGEILGNETALSTIDREAVERLCATLRKIPPNAVQRYRGMSVEATIAAAANRGDNRVLAPKSLENYFTNILAIFNFAVSEKFMKENPLSYPSLAEAFRVKRQKKKTLFSADELSSIFGAPIFTGCINDETDFSKRGPNRIKRGRFWVPLLALFQGLRCNEACQLHSEDVREIEGIPCLMVRTDSDEEEVTDKRVKNNASIRILPIHPELIGLGFLEFVEKRTCDKTSRRLFAELPAGSTARYSNPFSKWFGRFLRSTFETRPKATFHSFRHHFRDELRAARVSDENVELLGGWAGEGKQQRNYGKGPPLKLLLEDLTMVVYPGLDLSRLHDAE